MCLTLGTGIFATASKVQKTATKSSTEAEIVAVADGMNIPLWLRDFVTNQGYEKGPVLFEQDNMSCIALLQKGESTAAATKYFDVEKFWISDNIKRGEVVVKYVPTLEMTSDFFTSHFRVLYLISYVTELWVCVNSSNNDCYMMRLYSHFFLTISFIQLTIIQLHIKCIRH